MLIDFNIRPRPELLSWLVTSFRTHLVTANINREKGLQSINNPMGTGLSGVKSVLSADDHENYDWVDKPLISETEFLEGERNKELDKRNKVEKKVKLPTDPKALKAMITEERRKKQEQVRFLSLFFYQN